MILDIVIERTGKFLEEIPRIERKRIGQFFTSRETAEYMASLFQIPASNHVEVLDPGAGSGILSAALVERLLLYPHIKSIGLTCYENDEKILGLLKENLDTIVSKSSKEFSYKIINKNYIVSQKDDFMGTMFENINSKKYDLIIGNPPYKKVSKDAPEARAMPTICHGAPNLYFLFSAMSLFNLKNYGEMVYIIPRSWTSGAYFKAFRNYFLSEGKLLSIHLFVSRDKVFDTESVLQETIIVKLRKQREPIAFIDITTSFSNQDFSNKSHIRVPYSKIVTEPDKYVFLVTQQEEIDTLMLIRQFDDTLPSIGMRMKTGLTVDFRNRELLRDEPEDNTVPIFYSQHIKDGRVYFPINKEAEYILDKQPGLIQKNKNYLFVKRFTSKEENRRLQCGIYLAREYSGFERISTQNKINFIDSTDNDELSEEVVFGLYTLLNSSYYDKYYRILNGSTQVNSSEVNSMPVPPLNKIITMGKKLKNKAELSSKVCDNIILETIS